MNYIYEKNEADLDVVHKEKKMFGVVTNKKTMQKMRIPQRLYEITHSFYILKLNINPNSFQKSIYST